MTTNKIVDENTTSPAHTNSSAIAIVDDAARQKALEMLEFKLSTSSQNALTVQRFSQQNLDNMDRGDTIAVMHDKVRKVVSGDLSLLESTLTAQTVALDTMFNELARRASLNISEHIQVAETYLRLALKAQAQCARTIEVLAAMKNPPIVYAKQMNVANGNQQVNNRINQNSNTTPTHTKKIEIQQNELLENQHGKWMDNGKKATTSGNDKELATLATLNGRKNSNG